MRYAYRSSRRRIDREEFRGTPFNSAGTGGHVVMNTVTWKRAGQRERPPASATALTFPAPPGSARDAVREFARFLVLPGLADTTTSSPSGSAERDSRAQPGLLHYNTAVLCSSSHPDVDWHRTTQRGSDAGQKNRATCVRCQPTSLRVSAMDRRFSWPNRVAPGLPYSAGYPLGRVWCSCPPDRVAPTTPRIRARHQGADPGGA